MDTVKIGWGRKELSLDEPMSIPGQAHMRIAQGIHDPLYVTALCIDGGSGQDAVIFCSCDTISLRTNTIEQIRQTARQMCPDVPVEQLIMNATHTHTGGTLYDTPETSPDGKPIYPGAKYRAYYIQQCAEAVCQAWNNRQEGGIAYGYGYAVVAHSRRVVYSVDMGKGNALSLAPNGYGAMYGNTEIPEFSHYEAGADHFLNAMFTFDANEKLTGIVANVPCPSQVGELLSVLSADYWNEVRTLVAETFGPDVFVLPQCAPAGDTSPRILHYKKAQSRRMRLKYGKDYDLKKAKAGTQDYYDKIMCERWDIAERILEGLKDVYGWARKEILTQLPVRHTWRTMDLARRMITEEEKKECEQTLEEIRPLAPSNDGDPESYRVAITRYNSVKNRNEGAIERFGKQYNKLTEPVDAHAVRIGDIAFCTNRFELYQDFMHRVQARSPFLQTFVIQLAGAEGSTYLPTERGVHNKGYSASIFCNVVGPEGGQQWVEETLQMLNDLNTQEEEV